MVTEISGRYTEMLDESGSMLAVDSAADTDSVRGRRVKQAEGGGEVGEGRD